MFGVVEAIESLTGLLKDKVKTWNEKEISYIDGYFETQSYEEKLKGDKKGLEESVPFILLRPGKDKIEVLNGKENFQNTITIRVCIENKKSEGYKDVTKLAGEVTETLLAYPGITGGHQIDTSKITGEIEEELCGGDYWTYKLNLIVTLPVKRPSILREKGWV